MCERRCYETTADRKDFCGECAEGTRDSFEDQFFDTATRAIESLSASELAEIEADFRDHFRSLRHARIGTAAALMIAGAGR